MTLLLDESLPWSGRLDDLKVPPGNRLEALKGRRSGQFSIRTNDQWPVCFRLTAGGVEDVEIVAGRRAITADTDLRRCRFLGLSSGYWQRAQAAHDTELAERELVPVLKRIRPWAAVGTPETPRRRRA